jgi:hypothetical protein
VRGEARSDEIDKNGRKKETRRGIRGNNNPVG